MYSGLVDIDKKCIIILEGIEFNYLILFLKKVVYFYVN